MKWYFWILIIVGISLIVYFVYRKQIKNKLATDVLNGNFGDIANDYLNSKNVSINNQTVSCNPGCSLSTDTRGASNTVTVGNITYTCRCSDGSTSDVIINNNK